MPLEQVATPRVYDVRLSEFRRSGDGLGTSLVQRAEAVFILRSRCKYHACIASNATGLAVTYDFAIGAMVMGTTSPPKPRQWTTLLLSGTSTTCIVPSEELSGLGQRRIDGLG
jgi:hypothetical protein